MLSLWKVSKSFCAMLFSLKWNALVYKFKVKISIVLVLLLFSRCLLLHTKHKQWFHVLLLTKLSLLMNKCNCQNMPINFIIKYKFQQQQKNQIYFLFNQNNKKIFYLPSESNQIILFTYHGLLCCFLHFFRLSCWCEFAGWCCFLLGCYSFKWFFFFFYSIASLDGNGLLLLGLHTCCHICIFEQANFVNVCQLFFFEHALWFRMFAVNCTFSSFYFFHFFILFIFSHFHICTGQKLSASLIWSTLFTLLFSFFLLFFLLHFFGRRHLLSFFLSFFIRRHLLCILSFIYFATASLCHVSNVFMCLSLQRHEFSHQWPLLS